MSSFTFGIPSGFSSSFINTGGGVDASSGITYGLDQPADTRTVPADGTTYKTGSSIADVISALGNVAIGSIMAVRMPSTRISSPATVLTTPNTQAQVAGSSQLGSFFSSMTTSQWLMLAAAAILLIVLILKRRG